MDKIILGLLLLKPFIECEIWVIIKMRGTFMCTESAGNIQFALKKLVQGGHAVFEKGVENGINKKRCFITKAGKEEFYQRVKQPMSNKKYKNIAPAKLFFMGYLTKKEQREALLLYVEEMKEGLDGLKQPEREVFAQQ